MQTGYMVVIDAVLEGTVPAIFDECDKPIIFATRVEAEREIADNLITRLQEFIDGGRDFESAMTVEEYIIEVAMPQDLLAHQNQESQPS